MREPYALRVVVPARYQAVSFAAAQKVCRVDDDIAGTFDDDIRDYVAAAGSWVEAYTSLSLVPKTYEMTFDSWPGCGMLYLPRSPLISIDAITYVDANGTDQPWADTNFQVDRVGVPARLAVAYGGGLPSSFRSDLNAWKVRFTAGHTPTISPDDEEAYQAAVPPAAKLAMKVYIRAAFDDALQERLQTIENIAHPLRVALL